MSKILIHAATCIVLGASLSACSSLSMSDFGLGGDDKKKTVATNTNNTQTSTSKSSPDGPIALGGQQRTTASTAKKEEKGIFDRIGGWFGSDEKQKQTAQKGNNLTSVSALKARAATEASLRAAQDASKLQQQQPNAPVAAPKQLASTKTAEAVSPETKSTATTKSTALQNQTVAPAPQQQQQKSVATQQTKEKGFLDRIGGWFSSDSKKTYKSPNTTSGSTQGLKGNTNTLSSSVDVDDTESLTPVQTLRLARKQSQASQASSQGLVPYVPGSKAKTTAAPTKIAQSTDANLKTSSINTAKKTAQKLVTPQKLTKTKVSVKPLRPSTVAKKPTRLASVRRTTPKTEYVVTPESYKASRAAKSGTQITRPTPRQQVRTVSSPSGKADSLGSAAPSPSAYKFYFGPGSTNLAPHHIAQLKGLAGQAIASGRTITILGTSTPGGEAGSGATQAGLQSLATARAMAAAQNLQQFGVPGAKIKIRIAQSTTPSNIGTGGSKSFQALSARRVEIKLQ